MHSRSGFKDGTLSICNECLPSLLANTIPEAALAKGFEAGEVPSWIQDLSWVERAAAGAVRVEGCGTPVRKNGMHCERVVRRTKPSFHQDVCGEQAMSPGSAIDVSGPIALALVKFKVTPLRLHRLAGARRNTANDTHDLNMGYSGVIM